MANDSIKYYYRGNTLNIQLSHMLQHPEMENFLREAFQLFLEKEKNYIENTIKLEINMGRVIGKTNCISTSDTDDIFYAQRKGRKILSRFVKNVQPKDCDTITLVILRKSHNRFYLLTAYIGHMAEKEPLDPTITSKEDFFKSTNFWNHHALIEGQYCIHPDTITKECPWDQFENRSKINLKNQHDISNIIKNMRSNSIEPSNSNLPLK